MSTLPLPLIAEPCFELRFAPLGTPGAAVAVPCDEAGRVDLDGIDHATRQRYFYAHTLIGRDFARPIVRRIVAIARARRA